LLFFCLFVCFQLLDSNRRDLVGRQQQIAPLQAAIDALLTGRDLDVATRGDALQKQCTELLEGAEKASAHVQPAAVHSGCLLSLGLQLQLLAAESAILQPCHAVDMDRFFKGISLVSQLITDAPVPRIAPRASGRPVTQLFSFAVSAILLMPLFRRVRSCCTAPRATDSTQTICGSDAPARVPHSRWSRSVAALRRAQP